LRVLLLLLLHSLLFFFFTATAPPEIYTLSLHDALPIWCRQHLVHDGRRARSGGAGRGLRLAHRLAHRQRLLRGRGPARRRSRWRDRKSTRLNSSHVEISYAVFCLKKKKKKKR